MGWAEKSNINSRWNRKRVASTGPVISAQTTQKTEVKALTPAQQGEPLIYELSLRNIWGSICRRLKPKLPQNPAPTS